MRADVDDSAAGNGSTLLQMEAPDVSVTLKSKRKKKKSKRKKALYDQYLADSGSECSVEVWEGMDEALNAYECEEFEPGMDINILIQQTVQNVVQSVSLEDYDGLSRFGDSELICFGAALKHNSSILSLQIRYLDVSDTSLVPLCRALEVHPCIRALDLSGTRGGNATIKAVFRLVCTNPNILFIRLDDTMVLPQDAEDILLSLWVGSVFFSKLGSKDEHMGMARNRFGPVIRADNSIGSSRAGYAKVRSANFLFADEI
ncbi:hypothetical protein LSM04_006380 [Trypanosoma melophagium]|uniref:uncharacterized protein n=1 Tax=Trypanosoma melophagium TaxID=715481 RepID=UPI00351A33FB|nr:hypothetical protein LSM04_006380 [Trypanosoma melophagium]